MNDKLIVSIPTSDRQTVDGHFGHTKQFALYTILDNTVEQVDYVVPPKHEPGNLPQFLHQQGANVIISGGMGNMAVKLFESNNIEVILGATGSLEKTITTYLNNELESTGSACSHDDHDHQEGAC